MCTWLLLIATNLRFAMVLPCYLLDLLRPFVRLGRFFALQELQIMRFLFGIQVGRLIEHVTDTCHCVEFLQF